jgi:ribosomal 50S subunit-recycling heat shock protein
MAEPGAAVEVHGAVTVNGAVAKGDPEVLFAQIERTREDLARTINTLAERVSPASNVRLLREKAAEQVARPEVQLGAAALGVAVVGLTILRIWARRRRNR